MLIKILVGFVVVIGLFSIFVATRPTDYVVSREITIHASPKTLFPYINNSKLMDSWNPWSKMDPDAKMSFSGPEEGVGATTSWEGGKKLGTGSCTVTESVSPSLVKSNLKYIKPMNMTQDAEMSLTPSGDQTVVRWAVRGKNNFFGRAMCFFVNMDKMVGGTFEKGLSQLKTIVEKPKK